MNKYVVAFCSLHNDEIKQEIVIAGTKYLAMRSYLGLDDDDLYEATEEGIYQYAANTDSFITAIQIDNLPRSGRQGNDLQNHLTGLDSLSAIH